MVPSAAACSDDAGHADSCARVVGAAARGQRSLGQMPAQLSMTELTQHGPLPLHPTSPASPHT